MATDINDRENLQNELKKKRICRFCLTQQQPKLSSIFTRPEISQLSPLPVQVMACASIEVFTNDGMPSWICHECRSLFEHSYRFKQMCKRADNLLRQYPLTGEWPNPLPKPKIPKFDVKATQITSPSTATVKSNMTTKSTNAPAVKILNSSPAAAPEPPVPVRNVAKKETLNNEISNILNKVGYDDLSMEDVQRLIADVEDDEEFQEQVPVKRPPKVLNKSSMRILNKDANVFVEPKLSVPEVKLDHAGNVTVTAVINPTIVQKDSIKTAEPIATDVYPCPHCDRSFPLLQLRDIHMVNHSRERRFQCPDCDKSFFSKYDLQKHEVRHTGDKPFKCVVCERGFSRATLLHRHEKIHTEIPKYLCVHCEKPFLSKDEMEQHTARHEKNRPFKCRVCQKTFAFKQGLERHETVHSTVQPYPCQYCDQSFPTPSKLARHLTAHAGKRPYPCKYCNKSYVLSHHLSRHMRSHKQMNGMHVCTECKKIYKTRDDLIYHSAVHSTVSLVCTLCHLKLDSPAAVTVHIKQHVEGDAYACEFCDLMFLEPSALVAHAEEKHANDLAVYNVEPKSNENSTISNINIIEEHTIEEIDASNTHELKLFDDMEEENQVENVNDKNVEKIALQKKQMLNQIILSSKKDLKFFMIPDEEKKGEDLETITLSTDVRRMDQPAAKKRRIISVDGRLKEVECIASENNPTTKRKVVVLAEKKMEKDGVASSKASNAAHQKRALATKKDTIQMSTRSSNETKSTDNIKTEHPTKKIAQKTATTSTSKPSRADSPAEVSNAKQQGQQRLKRIKLSKSQAEAFNKQGRIQIKDGNMILTKEISPKTKVSRKIN